MMDYLNGHVIQIGEDLLLVNRNEKDENSKPTWEVAMFDLKTRSDKVETYEKRGFQKAPFFIKGFALNRSEIVLLYRNKFHIYNMENNKRSVILNLNNEEILDFIFFKGSMIYIKKGCMSIFRSSATGKKNRLLTLRAQPLSMGFSEEKNILTINANGRLFFLKIMTLKDKTTLIRNTNISIPFKNRKTKYVYHSHKNLSYQNKEDYKEVIHVCSYLSNCIVLCKHLKRGTKCNKKQFLKLSVEEFQESQIKRVFFFEINEAAMEKGNECPTKENADIVEEENQCEIPKKDIKQSSSTNSVNGTSPSSTDVLEVQTKENNTSMCETETNGKVANGDQSEQGTASTTAITTEMTTENNSCNESNMDDLKENVVKKWKCTNETQGESGVQYPSNQRMKTEEHGVTRENISEDTTIRNDIYNNHMHNGIEREQEEHKGEETVKDKIIADMSKLYLAVCSNHGKMLIYYIGPMDAEHIEADFTQCEKKPLVSLQLTNNVFDVKDVTTVLKQRTNKQLNVIRKKKKKSKKYKQYVEYMNNKNKCLWNYSFFQWFYLSDSGVKVYTVQIPNEVILEALNLRIKEREEAAKEGRMVEQAEKTIPLHLVDCDNKLIAIKPIENKADKQNMIKEIMKKSNFSYCSDSDSYIESDITWKESDCYSIDSFSTEPDAIDLTTDKDPMQGVDNRIETAASTAAVMPTMGGVKPQDVFDMPQWDLRVQVKKEPVSEDDEEEEQEQCWVVSNDTQEVKMQEKSPEENAWKKKSDSSETEETSAESKSGKEDINGSDTSDSSVTKRKIGSVLNESIAPLGNDLKRDATFKRVENEEPATHNEKVKVKYRIATEIENTNEDINTVNGDWEAQKKINGSKEEEQEEEKENEKGEEEKRKQKLFSAPLNENKVNELSTFKINTNYSNSNRTCGFITGMSNSCSLDTVSSSNENSEIFEKLKMVDTDVLIESLKEDVNLENRNANDEIENEIGNEKRNMEKEVEEIIEEIGGKSQSEEREDEETIGKTDDERQSEEEENEERNKNIGIKKQNGKEDKESTETKNEKTDEEIEKEKQNEKGKDKENIKTGSVKYDEETEGNTEGNTMRESEGGNVVAETDVEDTDMISPDGNIKGGKKKRDMEREEIRGNNNKNDYEEMKETNSSTYTSKKETLREENENVKGDSEESVCSERKRKTKRSVKDENDEKTCKKEKRRKEKEKKKKKMEVVTEEACKRKIKSAVMKNLDDQVEKEDAERGANRYRGNSEDTEKKDGNLEDKQNKENDGSNQNKKDNHGKNKKRDNNESDKEDKHKYKGFSGNCKNVIDNEKRDEEKIKKIDGIMEQQKETHKESNEITSKEKMKKEKSVKKVDVEKENKKRKKEMKEKNRISDTNEKEKKRRRKLENNCSNENVDAKNISEKEFDSKLSEQKPFEGNRLKNDGSEGNDINVYQTKDYVSMIAVIKSSLGVMDRRELDIILRIKDREVVRKTVKHLGKKCALKLFDYIVFSLSEKNRLVIDYFLWIVAICNIYKEKLKGKKYTGLVAKFQFLVNHCIKMQPAVASVIDKIKSILQRFEENETTDNTQILNYTDGTVKR